MFKYMAAMTNAILFGGTAPVYDETLARNYERLFSGFEEQETAKSLHFMLPDQLVEAMKKGEEIVILDVRTQREQSIVGITSPGTLHIPMNKVFAPESLAQIPLDKKLVVTCQSGVRCTAIAMALRDIGFANVYSLKGGLVKLTEYLDPKTAF